MSDKNLQLKKRNRLSLLKQSLQDNINEKGVIATFQKILKHISYKIKGIDFSEEELSKFTIESKNKNLATIHGSCGDEMLHMLLDEVIKFDQTVLRGSFLDYGSGKGMAVIYAKKYGFKKVIGVEFAKELCDIANKNIKKIGLSDIEIFYMDATEFIPSKGVRVIYFLNPFHERVLHEVLIKILKYKQIFLQDIYLIYNIPIYEQVFDKLSEFQKLTTCKYKDNKAHIYKLEVQ